MYIGFSNIISHKIIEQVIRNQRSHPISNRSILFKLYIHLFSSIFIDFKYVCKITIISKSVFSRRTSILFHTFHRGNRDRKLHAPRLLPRIPVSHLRMRFSRKGDAVSGTQSYLAEPVQRDALRGSVHAVRRIRVGKVETSVDASHHGSFAIPLVDGVPVGRVRVAYLPRGLCRRLSATHLHSRATVSKGRPASSGGSSNLHKYSQPKRAAA